MSETQTIEPETAPTAAPLDAPKETIEDIEKRAPAPPSGGVCQACKEPKPINRLKLCYECWLMDQLHKQSGGQWLPGDPHLATCKCDGPGGCSTKGQAN